MSAVRHTRRSPVFPAKLVPDPDRGAGIQGCPPIIPAHPASPRTRESTAPSIIHFRTSVIAVKIAAFMSIRGAGGPSAIPAKPVPARSRSGNPRLSVHHSRPPGIPANAGIHCALHHSFPHFRHCRENSRLHIHTWPTGPSAIPAKPVPARSRSGNPRLFVHHSRPPGIPANAGIHCALHHSFPHFRHCHENSRLHILTRRRRAIRNSREACPRPRSRSGNPRLSAQC